MVRQHCSVQVRVSAAAGKSGFILGTKTDLDARHDLGLDLGTTDVAVSYTHLTLPTTPYV